jgi:TDG/mug DNA glycosylase family protein
MPFVQQDAPETLPDLLREGLGLVFIGINPSVYSAVQGHYFARRANRFWPCFSRSKLSLRMREAIGVTQLGPEHDQALPAYGIGFTDVVKRPTPNVSTLSREEFATGAASLLIKLEQLQPGVACFQGIMGYRPFAALFGPAAGLVLGPQPLMLGTTRVFVVPSPSPANAHFTPAQQTAWYDRLAEFMGGSA